MAGGPPLTPRAPRPWVTLALTAAALAIFFLPATAPALVFRRTAIGQGQLWRLWTGHWVHYSAGHLLWDLLVFAAAGLWLERIAPRAARWFLLLAPPFISGLLLLGDPRLYLYAGLSGVASGLVVLLSMIQLRRDTRSPAWFWPAVLLVVMAKLVLESLRSTALFVPLDAGVRPVPLAHLGGVAAALAVFTARRWWGWWHRRRSRPSAARV